MKYILLGLFLYAVASMSVAAIRAFLEGPYGVIADVKMLNFFRFLSVTGAVIAGRAVRCCRSSSRTSGAVTCAPTARCWGWWPASARLRIRRAPDVCIDCAKCAKACPSLLPGGQADHRPSPECTGCLECVAVCPAEGALWMSAGKRSRVPAWALAVALAAIFMGVAGWARLSGHWSTNIPSQVYDDLIPRAGEFSHP